MFAQSPTTELGVRQHYPDWQLPVDTARPGPNTALPQKTEASLTRGEHGGSLALFGSWHAGAESANRTAAS